MVSFKTNRDGCCNDKWRGGVAQLVRVPPCHGGCCGFESRLSRHFLFLNFLLTAFERLRRFSAIPGKSGIAFPFAGSCLPAFAGQKPLSCSFTRLFMGVAARRTPALHFALRLVPRSCTARLFVAPHSRAPLLVESRLSRHFLFFLNFLLTAFERLRRFSAIPGKSGIAFPFAGSCLPAFAGQKPLSCSFTRLFMGVAARRTPALHFALRLVPRSCTARLFVAPHSRAPLLVESRMS